ncbi:transposase [Streptomyces fimicarius]|nr:transposase [Streptomyces fimicarius]
MFFKSNPFLVPRRDDLGVERGDLSDEQWSALETLLPVAVLGRPSPGVRTGVPRRDLPADYGPWQTVYGLFRR